MLITRVATDFENENDCFLRCVSTKVFINKLQMTLQYSHCQKNNVFENATGWINF